MEIMAKKEYIEREASIELIRRNYCKDCNSYNGAKCKACSFDDAILTINDVPSVDVVEVVHAEWEPNPYYNIYYCSKCGRQIEDESRKPYEHFPYCHCGAKMEETEAIYDDV